MATHVTPLAVPRPAQAGLRRFLRLLQANIVMYLRDGMAVFWITLFPIGLMLLFGVMYGYQPAAPGSSDSATVISFMAPGLVVLSPMNNGLVGNAGVMATWRERGLLRRIQTTPLPVWQLLLVRILTYALIMIGQALLMIGTSIVVFNARYQVWGLVQVLPVIVLGAVMFMAIGQAVAAPIRKVSTVTVVAQIINFPLMFLGGLWSPVSTLPEGLQLVAKLLPSTMLADLVRAPLLSGLNMGSMPLANLPLELSLLGVLAYLVGGVVIGARFFRWS